MSTPLPISQFTGYVDRGESVQGEEGKGEFSVVQMGGEDDGLLVKEQGVGLYSDPTPIYLFVYLSVQPLNKMGTLLYSIFIIK